MSRQLSRAQLPLELAFSGQHTFATFVWEPSQQLLQHQLLSASATPSQFNWLWGRAGVGKSHLLQALAQRDPDAIYLPAQRLLQFDSSVLQGLQDCPLLIIDDVQLLGGHSAWEEQLFVLCQQRLQADGCLWFAATASPAQTPVALKDLQSRLQLALVFEVQELSDQGKAQALTMRAHQRGIELRDDSTQYLLTRNQRNMHDLMNVLDQLDSQALAEQRKITIPFIKTALGW
jgi:DnaA-homolog protein